MKKTVISIILVLPFLLIVIISLSAKIVSNYRVIKVNSVCILDDNNVCYTTKYDTYIQIGKNQIYELNSRIFPDLASNKKVTYTSSNTDVCQINERGEAVGIEYGVSKISIFTSDGRKTASIYINVSDDLVSKVELVDQEEIILGLGQVYLLKTIVSPSTALNKALSWESEDPLIASVDRSGKITGNSAGSTIIRVTTIDGGYSDEITITIKNEKDFGFIDYINDIDVYLVNEDVLDLYDLLEFNEDIISKEDIRFEILSGDYISLEDNIINLKINKMIYLKAYVINTHYQSEIFIKFIE